MSNDAFHYLAYNEEPLDDDNLDEANEISALFANGFSISEWSYVEGEDDLIEATLVPYVEDNIKYDGIMDYIAKNWVFKYKAINQSLAYVCIENQVTGEVKFDANCEIKQISGKPWAIVNGSQIPLWKCNRI